MSKNVKIDRRILRTKSSLQEALKALMKQKPYAKIKVSEIVEVANIARPTFYMHYETKDDLLFSLFNDVFDGFKDKLASEFADKSLNPTDLAIELFRYWDANSHTFKILLDAEIDLIVLDQIQQCSAASLQTIFTTQLEVPNPLIPYFNDAFAGSFFMVLKRWIGEGKKISAEELGAFFGVQFEAQIKLSQLT